MLDFRPGTPTLGVFRTVLALLFLPMGCAEQKEGTEGDEKTRIAWGVPARGLVCGLSLSKGTYKVGEPIVGTLYLNNLGDSNLRIVKPKRPRDYRFEIAGPPLGSYERKGPGYESEPVTEDDFVVLSPGTIYEQKVVPDNQIEQQVGEEEPHWESVIPGRYKIRIKMWIYQGGEDSWVGRIRTGEVEIRVVQ